MPFVVSLAFVAAPRTRARPRPAERRRSPPPTRSRSRRARKSSTPAATPSTRQWPSARRWRWSSPTSSGLGGGALLAAARGEARPRRLRGRPRGGARPPPRPTCTSMPPATSCAGLTLNGPLAAGIPGSAGRARARRRALRPPAAVAQPRARDSPRRAGRADAHAHAARAALPAIGGGEIAAVHGGVLPGRRSYRRSATVIRQPDLAATLRRLAAKGFDGYYRGATAEQLVAGRARRRRHLDARGPRGLPRHRARAGPRHLPRHDDRLRAAAFGRRHRPRGHARTSSPATTSRKLDGATRKHVMIEAMRRAYRDRSIYLGDPAFTHGAGRAAPAARSTRPASAPRSGSTARRRARCCRRSCRPAAAAAIRRTSPSSTRTGNRVAVTQSINTWYGSAFMAPGTGVVLNNEMDDFTVKAGVANWFELIGSNANSIAPGKRMLSSMSPTFLESTARRGDPRYARRQPHHHHGAAGGARVDGRRPMPERW